MKYKFSMAIQRGEDSSTEYEYFSNDLDSLKEKANSLIEKNKHNKHNFMWVYISEEIVEYTEVEKGVFERYYDLKQVWEADF